ncbi:MAG: hypothetical protein EA408_08485 [Marinilabiliales bacterium]|nr:MAG: hypothetical protein EA408_08485 [Marinilabiliales bacterium]
MAVKISLAKSILVLIYPIIIFSGCRSVDITSREDFDKLNEIRQIEYVYALNEGIKYRIIGDYENAYYYLKRSLNIFPFSDVANYELSYVYFVAGEKENATEYAGRALELDPENRWYYLHLAGIYRELDDFDNAINVYYSALEYFPGEIDLFMTLGAMLGYTERYDEAILVYNRAQEITGINEKISLSRKSIYMETGQYEKAHEEIIGLIDKFPLEPAYHGVLAELYSEMEMFSEALESYRTVFRLDPENGMAQLSVAEFYLRTGKFDEAVHYLVNAFRNPGIEYSDKAQVLRALIYDESINNRDINDIMMLGRLLVDEYPGYNTARIILAEYHIQSGQYEESVPVLLELYENDTGNIIIAEQLISVLSFLEKNDKIVEIGPKLVNSFPGSGIIVYFTGNAFNSKELRDEAIELLTEAAGNENIELEMRSHIFALLGDIYNNKEEFELSDQYFKMSLDADGNNIVAMNNHAYYLALRGEKLDRALELSRIAVDSEPGNSAFLDTYAWVLYNLGEYDEALSYIEKAYQYTGSERYEIVKHYGQILIQLGRNEEAEIYFIKARDLADDEEEIEILLETVRKKL